MLAQDAGTAPFYFTGVRVELEGIPYIAAIGIDLTESKKAEEAVSGSEAELRSFVQKTQPYGIGTIAGAVGQIRTCESRAGEIAWLPVRSRGASADDFT